MPMSQSLPSLRQRAASARPCICSAVRRMLEGLLDAAVGIEDIQRRSKGFLHL